MKNNTFDGKLFTLLLLKQWKKVLLWTVLGALIVGVPYFLSKTIIGNFDYRAEVSVHVEYAEDTAGNKLDYINYYTWGQWITSDAYVDGLISEYGLKAEKDMMKTYLGAQVPADQRMVVFTIVTKNKGLTDAIASAVYASVADFITENIAEVDAASVINVSPAVKYFIYNNTPQALVFGALMGFAVSIFCIWIYFLLDDSVYIPELFEKETGLFVTDEHSDNELAVLDKCPDMTDAKDDLTLVVQCGAHNGKALNFVLHECKKRGIKIKNARLENLDTKLVNAYYRGSKFPNPFMKG